MPSPSPASLDARILALRPADGTPVLDRVMLAKTEAGGTGQAVHEVLAQTRFTHFGHLVRHRADGLRAEARLTEIAARCEAYGAGPIRPRDPRAPGTGEIVLDPRRRPTVIDGFLESRLSREHRARPEAAVRGAQG